MLLRPWMRPRPARAARTDGARAASAPSWTSAPGGAVSSAKPASPRTTSGPEDWKAGPSVWARQDARSASRAPAVTSAGAASLPGGGSPAPSASHAASTIDCQPVQRHRWARRAASTSWRDGSPAPPRSPRAARRITMPGVQKPHWLAPRATKASAQRSRCSGARPSRVVTLRPATRRTGVTHATRGNPSTHTVQHPHCPCGLQPSLRERQPSSSRSASRSETPSPTTTGSPFRVKETGAPPGPATSGPAE